MIPKVTQVELSIGKLASVVQIRCGNIGHGPEVLLLYGVALRIGG